MSASMSIWDKSIIGQFDRRTVDAAKGVLILSVILGHIRVLIDEYPLLFVIVNNFHVACFLLLPFLYDIRSFNKESLNIWIGRYFVPFVFFTVVYSALYFVAFHQDQSFLLWLEHLMKALLIGTSIHIDAATGMQSLWFLPTLLAVVMLLGIVKSLRIPFVAVLCLAVLAHGFVGGLSEDVRLNIPLGLVSVGYIFAIGLILRFVCAKTPVERWQKYSLGFLTVAIGLQLVSTFYTQTRVGFSMMRFQTFDDVGALLLHDALLLCVLGFLLTTAFLKRSKALCYLGQYSLQIYLLHHFIYGALYTVLSKVGVSVSGDVAVILYGLVLYAVVLILCLGIIALLKRTTLLSLLFPRSLTGLKEDITGKVKR